MKLCGMQVEAGEVDAFGALDDSSIPLDWLASLSSCGLLAEVTCTNEACSRKGITVVEKPTIKVTSLAVDMSIYVLSVGRGKINGEAPNEQVTVGAAIAWRIEQLSRHGLQVLPCAGTITKHLRNSTVQASCAAKVAVVLKTEDGQLPPIAVADFGAQLKDQPAKAVLDAIVPEDVMTVIMGDTIGIYDLVALVYHVSNNHFVSQFNYKGRAFFHDGMANQGRPMIVGSKIDVSYGFRDHEMCAYAKAIYALRITQVLSEK